jgi:hypothetical protein
MKSISARDLDEKFDSGEDISEYLDWGSARRGSELDVHHVEIALPSWMLRDLDREAEKRGVTRQMLVQRWLEERLQDRSGNSPDETLDVAE